MVYFGIIEATHRNANVFSWLPSKIKSKKMEKHEIVVA
jgi:hypothetical protein